VSPRKKKIAFVIFLVAVSLTLLNIDSRTSEKPAGNNSGFPSFFSRIQSITSKAVSSIGNFIESLCRSGTLLYRNEELVRENRQLREKIARLKSYERENEEFRKLLDFRRQRGMSGRGTGAQVIGRNVTNWYRTVIIDKGSEHAITEGMIVVSYEGLVGKVISVGPVSSRVMLILDDRSSISGMVERTGEQGIVEGQLTNVLRMKYLPGKADARKGDVVRSSGYGGIYPEGLLIGEIKSVYSDEYGLTVSAEVVPAVRFSRLENVLVMEK